MEGQVAPESYKDIVLFLATAGVVVPLFRRWKISPILGFIGAGIVLGPFGLGALADRFGWLKSVTIDRPEEIAQLAEFGVVFLLFMIGLELSWERLRLMRLYVFGLGGLQVTVSVAVIAAVALALGVEPVAATAIGAALALSSTAVVMQILTEKRRQHSPAGRATFSVLLFQDLAVAPILITLAVVGRGMGEETFSPKLLLAFGPAVLGMIGLVAFGRLLLRPMMRSVARAKSEELFMAACLLVVIGAGLVSALTGLSMALGAFLAGTVVGRSDFGLRAASEALPMRDAFAVLFFVSVGMLFNPATIFTSPWLLAATLAIVLLAKPLAIWACVILLGHPRQDATSVAVSLAQIGEFSFILAALGRQLGVLPETAINTLVATAIVSITLNPLLYRLIEPFERWLVRRGRASIDSDDADSLEASAPSHRAIVVGYGPVGQTVTQLLLDNEIVPTVIELNLDTVRRLKAFDVRAIYGDAMRPDILIEAGIKGADNLILTSGSSHVDEEIVRQAKELNPDVTILARSQYVRELPKLHRAGAEDVLSAEGVVALAFTVRILERLGATGEQIDRERARVEATFRNG